MGGAMLITSLFSQKVQPLKTGDSVPQFLWSTPMLSIDQSGSKTNLNLSKYNDKLIILDFWSTWCSTCIGKFPTLYSLQQQNQKDLEVILVNAKSTGDPFEKVNQFLSKRKAAYHFTSIVEDTVLKKAFPHHGVPYYAWIKDNKVVAITDADGITERNIEMAIRGQKVTASITPTVPYDPTKPLFENGNGGNPPTFIYKSVLTPFVDGLKFRIFKNVNDQGQVNRISLVSCSVMDIYRFAYPFMANFTPSQIVLEVTKPSRLSQDSSSYRWRKQNVFNYESSFPYCAQHKAMEILRSDLDRYFGYGIIRTKKEIGCWILRATDTSKTTTFPKELKRETNLYDHSGLPIYFNNYPLPSLIHELDRRYNEPFIDETGIDVPVTLSLPANLRDIAQLQSSLASQGLSLVKENRKIPVVIIKDRK